MEGTETSACDEPPDRARRTKLKVFMSFAPPDGAFAEELKQQVEATELFQVISFDLTQQWHNGVWNVALLHSLIQEAEAFLAIFSQHTVNTDYLSWLRYEYGFAVFRAGVEHPNACALVRVVVADATSDTTDVPAELMLFQSVDYRDPHSHELSLDHLAIALRSKHSAPSLQKRQRYVFNEALAPNPRQEMFRRVLGAEFDRAFKQHIGPLAEKVQHLADLQRAQDNLMTPEIISVEEANAFDDIWVVSHSLHNDLYEEKICASIIKNLKKGIRYIYFVPRTPLMQRRRGRFDGLYGKYIARNDAVVDDLGSVRFVFLEAGVFMPFDELVVYDGQSATNRWGYIQMNYDRPTGSSASAGLVMKVPDRTLNTIVEFLLELQRRDSAGRKPGSSGGDE